MEIEKKPHRILYTPILINIECRQGYTSLNSYLTLNPYENNVFTIHEGESKEKFLFSDL